MTGSSGDHRGALHAIVLAAGAGSRMQSARAKPLHALCGRPILLYVLDALVGVGVERIAVVVGPSGDDVAKLVREHGPDVGLDFAEQVRPRGTADATLVGLDALDDAATIDPDLDDVLVMPGDAPLVDESHLRALVARHRGARSAATIAVHEGAGPAIVDVDDRGVRAIEQHVPEPPSGRDGGPLRSAGFYCFRHELLGAAVRRVLPSPDDGELRLADAIEVLAAAGHQIATSDPFPPSLVRGVHDRVQLAAAEADLRERINARWLEAGVTMVDPARTYIDSTVSLAGDVVLHPGVMLHGRTVVGPGCVIGADSQLTDCAVGAGAHLERTWARDAEVGARAVVGPYAVLQPGAQIPAGAVTGPFYTAGTSEQG